MPIGEGFGWDLLTAGVEQNTRRGSSATYESLTAPIMPGSRGLLKEAARRRGISIVAYCRRALAAFIVHDLGLDWDEFMQREPQTQPFGSIKRGQHLSGAGYGSWKVGCDDAGHP